MVTSTFIGKAGTAAGCRLLRGLEGMIRRRSGVGTVVKHFAAQQNIKL
jgi:hypothetical protein